MASTFDNSPISLIRQISDDIYEVWVAGGVFIIKDSKDIKELREAMHIVDKWIKDGIVNSTHKYLIISEVLADQYGW